MQQRRCCRTVSCKATDSFYRAGDFADATLKTIQWTLEPWQDRSEYVQGNICYTLPIQVAVDEVLASLPGRPFYMLGDRAYIIKGVE
jgi:hypothetical protein